LHVVVLIQRVVILAKTTDTTPYKKSP